MNILKEEINEIGEEDLDIDNIRKVDILEETEKVDSNEVETHEPKNEDNKNNDEIRDDEEDNLSKKYRLRKKIKKTEYVFEESRHQCKKCFKQFKSKSKLLNHFRVHQKASKFTCALCKTVINTNKQLIEHKKIHEGEGKIFICGSCEVAFSNHCDWLIHNLKHIDTYKCEECEQTFIYKLTLEKHIYTHYHREKICPICKKVLTNETAFDRHVKGHKYSAECVECGKFCPNSTYKYHMYTHTGVKPYQCLYCGKGFANIGQRVVHTRIHTNERPYECEICGFKSRQQTDYKRHLVTHQGKKTYECDYCNAKFSHKETIIYHIRNHVGYKPYPCTVCKESFIRFEYLKRHTVLRHTKAKVYECIPCGLKFKLKMYLNKHMKSRKHLNMVA